MIGFKPNLAGIADTDKLQLPVYASPKYDGVRAEVFPHPSGLRSRKLLEFPNKYVMGLFSREAFEYYDGELVLAGKETSPDCFRSTSSVLARADGQPNVMFHVFDHFANPNWPFTKRYGLLSAELTTLQSMNELYSKHVRLVEQRLCLDLAALLEYEEELVTAGWEGGDDSLPRRFL